MPTLHAQNGAQSFLPEARGIRELQTAAASCKGCGLWENATQTVFGAGREQAPMILIGEQPGDQEDIKGIPFCGPAGRLLDGALAEAGIEREEVYITNAVKHFKWVARGKRRLHQKPNSREISACRPWLVAELEAIRPDVVVCLGATAIRAVFDKQVKISEHRGKPLECELSHHVIVTVHPSSILRIQDEDLRELATQQFVADLREAKACIP